jgi:hypothetical protein
MSKDNSKPAYFRNPEDPKPATFAKSVEELEV